MLTIDAVVLVILERLLLSGVRDYFFGIKVCKASPTCFLLRFISSSFFTLNCLIDGVDNSGVRTSMRIVESLEKTC